MMESIYSEVETFFGGSGLVKEAPHMWGHETALFGGKVDLSTFLLNTAPESDESLFEENPGQQPDWMPSEEHLNLLDDLVNEANIVDNFIVDCPKGDQPLSPSGSYDSGVSSPGSYCTFAPSGISSPTSSGTSSENGSLLDDFHSASPASSVTASENGSLFLEDCHSASPASTHSSTEDNDELRLDDELLEALGIEVKDEPTIPFSLVPDDDGHLKDKLLPARTSATKLLRCDNNLAFSVAAANHGAVSNSPQPLSTFPVVLAAPQSEAKSKPGRKLKITNVEEKKLRKRDQNKHAATRYRERKRQVAMERESELNELSSRNKSLRDEVTQINREIDYLKELMIEVYTIKGLIR